AVGDRLCAGVALEVSAWRDGGSDFLARLLHARRAIGHPVNVDELVVRAAVGLAGLDRGRQRDRAIGGDGAVIVRRPTGEDVVVFAVAAGWRSGRSERDDEISASHDLRPFTTAGPAVKAS